MVITCNKLMIGHTYVSASLYKLHKTAAASTDHIAMLMLAEAGADPRQLGNMNGKPVPRGVTFFAVHDSVADGIEFAYWHPGMSPLEIYNATLHPDGAGCPDQAWARLKSLGFVDPDD
jgi:hypothetical protein